MHGLDKLYSSDNMKTNPNEPINPMFNSEGFPGYISNVMPDSDKQYSSGLSKREYFAAMAMQGVLAGHYEYFTGNADVSVPSEIAKYAVFNADALIEELNKESKR